MNDFFQKLTVKLPKANQNIQVSYFWYQPTNGSRSTLLILPGLDESIKNYRNFIDELKVKFPTYSILAIDLRGQGETLDSEEKIKSTKIKIEDQVAIVKEIIKILPIESIFIMGLSYGGGVGLCLGSKLENVKGMALLAPYVSKFKNFNRGVVGVWYTLAHMNPFYKSISQLSLPMYFKVARDHGELNPEINWDSNKLDALTKLSVGIMDISTTKEALRLPPMPFGTHFLVGEKDKLVSTEAVTHLFKKVRHPNKSIKTLPDAGHRLIVCNYPTCIEWLQTIIKN